MAAHFGDGPPRKNVITEENPGARWHISCILGTTHKRKRIHELKSSDNYDDDRARGAQIYGLQFHLILIRNLTAVSHRCHSRRTKLICIY